MPDEDQSAITVLLGAIRNGEDGAREALFDCVYKDLVRIAKGEMRSENKGHTLQTTALVHEAYLRLNNGRTLESIEDRSHFFTMAVTVMRHLLVDHARARKALKREGAYVRVHLDAVLEDLEYRHDVDYLDFEDALSELSRLDERQCRIVELRLLAGLKNAEVAEQLSVSESTVEKDLKSARAWLNRKLVR